MRGDGRFGALNLEPYWSDDWRHPLLIQVDGALAGFALVAERSKLTGAPGVCDMAEFFVMRRYRRRGVGLTAAFATFDRFPGRWEVRERDENPVAIAFWRRAIAAYTDGRYTEARVDAEWHGVLQAFATR